MVLRLLSGFGSSVTIANFGGTIADLWPHEQTGKAMSVFLWAAVVGSPSGYFLLAFVAQIKGWRSVFWALLGISGGFWIILVIVLVVFRNATRHPILLERRAKRLRKEYGNQALEVPVEMQRNAGLLELIKIHLSRPFRFLCTEAIIIFGALYNGYLYGLSFLFNDAFVIVFGKKGYGFNTIETGLTFLGLVVGVSLGPFINLWQERYYQRRIQIEEQPRGNTDIPIETVGKEKQLRAQNIPEARVQLGMVAAVTFPVSLFWFAWTCNYTALPHTLDCPHTGNNTLRMVLLRSDFDDLHVH